RFGYSRDKNGLDIEVPFYWAINEHSDATFYQRYMSERGWKQGAELRYYLGADTFGTLYGDFLRDRKQGSDIEESPRPDWQGNHNRWSYYLNHQTTFSPGFTLRSDIRKVSDRWYFKDFSSHNYYLDNYSQTGQDPFRRVSFLGNDTLGSLDSTVRLTKDWPLYNLTALARYTDDFSSDSNDATLQKYPEVILTGFRRPLLGDRLQGDFTGNYTYFHRNTGQKGHLGQISPTLYLPMTLGPYLAVTPQAGFQGDLWERSDSPEDRDAQRGTRGIYRFGASLSSEVYRVYTIGGPTVEKMRHAIRPEISYTYIPESVQNRIPDFLAQVPAQNSVTYGLTQTLTSRMKGADGRPSYREVMRLKLSQSYDIKEQRREPGASGADNRPFSAVAMELDLAPAPYVTMAARNTYNVNSGGWTQSNYDLNLSNQRGDWLSAGYRYTRGSVEEVNLSLKASLTSALDVHYSLKRNLLGYKNVEALYRLKYHKQCWDIELNFSDAENNRGVMVYVSLSGFRKEAFR
ncbi:MAG TPA: LPS assembly protein LptD, partial [Magnetospirillaceae bacterium]|nr:LPS assembly protein LptD [Magnetospirillaceae bacterium]